MLLSIVLLNYKKKFLTLGCIRSIARLFPKELLHGIIEVIVVDNKSPDDSFLYLQKEIKKQKFKHVNLIRSHANLGFANGCNLGANSAKGKYLLFLNNDTTVEDKGILGMASFLQTHPEVGILGGSLKNPDHSIQPSVGTFYTPIRILLLLLGLQKTGIIDKTPDHIGEVDWVKGALFMIRKDVFQKLGGFDKNIFMYAEDMELCYRAKKAGYKVYFYPQVTIIHQEQGSSSRSFAIVHIYKNLLYFYRKHRSAGDYQFVKFVLWCKAQLLLMYGKITHNNYLIHTYGQALKAIR